MAATAHAPRRLSGFPRFAAWLRSLSGWRRAAAAFVLGACVTAALPPVHALPFLFVAFPGLVWLIEGCATGRAALSVGWWFGFGNFVTGLYWIAFALLVDAAQFGWMVPFAVFGLSAYFAIYPAAAAWALWRSRARGIADPVPADVLGRVGLVGRGQALHDIHLPDSMDARHAARRRLAFDEVLRVQVMLVARKLLTAMESRGFAHRTTGPLVDAFESSLPFPLTGAQTRVIEEIVADISDASPMHRLLQGDVGSGKTVVAVSAMMRAVQGGHQSALMAPTEVLADQHAIGIRHLLHGLVIPDDDNLFGGREVRGELLTNKVTGEQRRKVMAEIGRAHV